MIDKNGNFTHTKIKGTEKEVIDFLNKTVEIQKNKSIAEEIREQIPNLIVYWRNTGTLPIGILLSYAMPLPPEGTTFREFNENENEAEITFDLPPRLTAS
jgi:hypothetical protein